MENKIYTVGEIAKICNISASQLRYYDNIGVIKPSYRNPNNGYRYYTEEQIEQLIFLYDLKKIGVVLKRALYFITCSGRMMYPTKLEEDYICRNLISDKTQIPKDIRNSGYEQLSLFDTNFLATQSQNMILS